jgi:chlorobactene glucosyltransferase
MTIELILFFVNTTWLIFILYFLYLIGKLYFKREFLIAGYPVDPSRLPFLSVIVPARNEESNIERCLQALINQSYPDDKFKIIVVDDHSTDRTAFLVQRLMSKHPNIHLVQANELPQGWTGKNNACWKGITLAEGPWYCFMDADVSAEPELLQTAVSFAEEKRIDMLSINPFQELISFSERLILPAVFISIASSINYGHVNDPSKPEALANGQFILFKRKVYEAIGGHHVVSNEVMEDIALARVVKAAGFRLYWIFGDALIRTRMYQNLKQIWEGFSKNLIQIMGKTSTINLTLNVMKFISLGWLPVVLPLLAIKNLNESILNFWSCILSVLGTVLLFLFFWLTLKALKIPFRYVCSFPIGFTFQVGLTFNSYWKYNKGARKWKGRTYN